MTKWLHLRRTEAKTGLTPFEIRKRLPEDVVETQSGGFRCSRSIFRGLFGTRFEWRLVARESSYCLIEDVYVSSRLFLITALVLIGMLISTVITPIFSGFRFLLMMGVTNLFTFTFALLIWVQIGVDSPLQDVMRKGRNRDQYMPIASFVAGVLVLVVLLTRGSPFLQILAVFGAVLLSVVYWRYNEWVARWSFWWQKGLLQTVGRLPGVFGNYLIGLLLMTGLVALFLILMQYPSFSGLLRYSPFLFASISTALFLFIAAYCIRTFREAQQIEAVQFDQHGLDEFSRTESLVLALTAVLVSMGFAVLSVYALVGGLAFVSKTGPVTAYFVLFAALLPFFYVLGGVAYQLATFIYGNATLFLNSENRDLELSSEYPVRVLDSEICMAGAVSLFFREFIVVSEGLLDELEEEELEAVVAHEQAHLEYGDTRIAVLVGALSPFVFTGRNVLFSVLGFREREHRADEYAANKVGQESLADALDRLQSIRYESVHNVVPEFSPTINNFRSERVRNLWDRIYGFYYGNFALSDAHPSIEQRKTLLQSDSDSN
ncbi:M48 family metalloprotease [Halobellus rubicundus]|uniref:M48 family metalloprotease n=1 Tax=Halobellus rubicundus TaxID=2996466 RepID=A0ABD5MC45_9EURY